MLVGFFDIMIRYVRTISDTVRDEGCLSHLLFARSGNSAFLRSAGTVKAGHATADQREDPRAGGLARTPTQDTPIGSGDLLHIDVFDAPELSRDVRVSDVGVISYPLIPNKIQASGLSTFQLEEKMSQLLIENGLVSHPQVSVFIKEQISQPVSVVGAVARPMVFQVIRPTTLLEVLTAAGGIADNAGNVVIITRASHPAQGKADDLRQLPAPTLRPLRFDCRTCLSLAIPFTTFRFSEATLLAFPSAASCT